MACDACRLQAGSSAQQAASAAEAAAAERRDEVEQLKALHPTTRRYVVMMHRTCNVCRLQAALPHTLEKWPQRRPRLIRVAAVPGAEWNREGSLTA